MSPALATRANKERAGPVIMVGVFPRSGALVARGAALNRLELLLLLLHDAVEPGDGGESTVGQRLRRGAAAAAATAAFAALTISLAVLALRAPPVADGNGSTTGCAAAAPPRHLKYIARIRQTLF